MPIVLSAPLHSFGNHQLQVTYNGGQNQNPLSVCGVATSPSLLNPYNNITANAATSITAGDGAYSSRPTVVANNHTSDTAVIVGAIIGGMILGALVVIGILLLRRHRRRQETPRIIHFESAMTENVISPHPFPARPRRDFTIPTPLWSHASIAKFPRPVIPNRSSLSKSVYSTRSFRSFKPSPQTAQVGSEYGRSPPHTPNGITGNTLDTELER